MERIYTTLHSHQEVLVVDYSSLKEVEMIRLMDSALSMVLKDNKPVRVLNIFHKNYITPGYMRHIEKELPRAGNLVEKQAVVGLTKVQLWILLGVNLWSKTKIHHFNTVDEALDYLTLA